MNNRIPVKIEKEAKNFLKIHNYVIYIENLLNRTLINIEKNIKSIKTEYDDAKKTKKKLILWYPINSHIVNLNKIILLLSKIYNIIEKTSYKGGFNLFHDKSKDVSPYINYIILRIKELSEYISYNHLSKTTELIYKNYSNEKIKNDYIIMYEKYNTYIISYIKQLIYLLTKLKENIKYKTDNKIIYIYQKPNITNIPIKTNVSPRGGTKKPITKKYTTKKSAKGGR